MKKLQCGIYRVIRFFVRLFYPKMQIEGTLPQEPCVVVGNHCQMNGPVAGELYFPGKHKIWCASEMMELKKVPDYAYSDFWSAKPKWCRWFYRLLSYLIAPISVCVFNCAHTIPVYRDHRLMLTFKQTVASLKAGANVVIFPEHGERYDDILCCFQEGFVDVARSYYRQTGKKLQFVPMYLAPKLGKMVLGEPVMFDPDAPIAAERHRIAQEMMRRISSMAKSQPRHRVVPYHNIPKREYPWSREVS